jgi:hypothetical protein
MWEIFLDKLPLILIIAAIFVFLFFVFPLAFFICIVVPFLTLKTGYHALVKHIHEHGLWGDMFLILAVVLFIIMVVLYFYGFRF